MAISVFDSYALEQANQLAKKQMSNYHQAREKAHKEATRKIVLVPTPEQVAPSAKKRQGSDKK